MYSYLSLISYWQIYNEELSWNHRHWKVNKNKFYFSSINLLNLLHVLIHDSKVQWEGDGRREEGKGVPATKTHIQVKVNLIVGYLLTDVNCQQTNQRQIKLGSQDIFVLHRICSSGSPQKKQVAEDKCMVGDNGALVRLGKAVTFLFTHLERHYECFYYN